MALGFDFTNGFHDTGNAMATSIATGALSRRSRWRCRCAQPGRRVPLAERRGAPSPSGLVDTAEVTVTVVFAGLSRRHHLEPADLALRYPVQFVARPVRRIDRRDYRRGGRAARQLDGPDLQGHDPRRRFAVHRRAGRGHRHLADLPDHPERVGRSAAGRLPRGARSGSASLVSLAHGTDDAQKTMGVIALALITNGTSPATSRRTAAVLGHPVLRAGHRPRHLHRAAGGSSARWARAWSRSSRRRAWRPSRPRPRSS